MKTRSRGGKQSCDTSLPSRTTSFIRVKVWVIRHKVWVVCHGPCLADTDHVWLTPTCFSISRRRMAEATRSAAGAWTLVFAKAGLENGFPAPAGPKHSRASRYGRRARENKPRAGANSRQKGFSGACDSANLSCLRRHKVCGAATRPVAAKHGPWRPTAVPLSPNSFVQSGRGRGCEVPSSHQKDSIKVRR